MHWTTKQFPSLLDDRSFYFSVYFVYNQCSLVQVTQLDQKKLQQLIPFADRLEGLVTGRN